ncbi:MAG: tetratricopeptide repeat protein [Pontiella sp.]|nr:tetratricopeptide repeat protein [Pontiella sp.]
MKNSRIAMLSTSVFMILAMFAGCGEHSGEKEYSKAMDAWKSGNLVRARTLFEKSIRKTSGNEKKSAALNQLGLILWQLNETDAAAEAFSKSCNLTENLTGANLNMGIALFHAGRLDDAEVALNNVLGETPGNETALAMLGMIEMRKQNWSGAASELTKSYRADPRSPAALNALALAELHKNQSSDAAIRRLQQVASAYPSYAPAAYNLALIYDQWLGNKSAAREWYTQYLQRAGAEGSRVADAKEAVERLGGPVKATASPAPLQSTDATRLMTEGAKLLSEKRYKDAAVLFQKAVEAEPKNKFAHYNSGHALFNLKQYRDAGQAYVEALKLDPRYADARYMLAYSLVQVKQWKDAEREAKELLKVDTERGSQMLKYISEARKR